MKHHLSATLIFLALASPLFGVDISEDIFAGAPHFIIKTKSATYYLDKEGGGLSRMIDRFGNDWISFTREPWDRYPESASSSFRGIPNLVYGSEDSGAGHPGHKKCYSFKVDEKTILTISKSGMWQWRWTFFEQYARLEMEKVDPNHKYWFLYEGPIAGDFAPEQQYWGNNLGGPRNDFNDFYKGDMVFANWHWVYFGDRRVKQILFLAMEKPDRQIDAHGLLGNSPKGIDSDDGMVVFGFGRQSDSQPQLTDPYNTFYFGFIKMRVKTKNGHTSASKDIIKLLD